jgi:hypothetical protein
MTNASNNARISAAVGAGIWVVLLFLRTADSGETELIQKILLLGILVIVPLGLSQIPRAFTLDNSWLFQASVAAQPVAAVACTISFLLLPGKPAAILAVSWLLVAIVIALGGLERLRKRGPVLSVELCIDAGMLYLPVGAGWLIAYRLGIQPLGFGDTIVLLTAMHFHFAGFAAPVLAGLAGRLLPESQSLARVFGVSGVCIVGGTPLVAAGITFSPALALIGAAIISMGLTILAVLVIGWILNSVRPVLARMLLLVSSLASVAAMVLACLYAYSLVARTVILDIPQMALSHGLLNAFGFALCGLVGWSLMTPARETAVKLDK